MCFLAPSGGQQETFHYLRVALGGFWVGIVGWGSCGGRASSRADLFRQECGLPQTRTWARCDQPTGHGEVFL